MLLADHERVLLVYMVHVGKYALPTLYSTAQAKAAKLLSSVRLLAVFFSIVLLSTMTILWITLKHTHQVGALLIKIHIIFIRPHIVWNMPLLPKSPQNVPDTPVFFTEEALLEKWLMVKMVYRIQNEIKVKYVIHLFFYISFLSSTSMLNHFYAIIWELCFLPIRKTPQRFYDTHILVFNRLFLSCLSHSIWRNSCYFSAVVVLFPLDC